MRISSISSKGQITIPRNLQLLIGLRPNSKVMIYHDKDILMVKPMKTSVVDQTAGSLGTYIPSSKRGKDFNVIEREMKKKAATVSAAMPVSAIHQRFERDDFLPDDSGLRKSGRFVASLVVFMIVFLSLTCRNCPADFVLSSRHPVLCRAG